MFQTRGFSLSKNMSTNTYENKTLNITGKNEDGHAIIRPYSFNEIVELSKTHARSAGYYMSRTFIHWPDDGKGILPEFLKSFEILIKSHFEKLLIERNDNHISISAISGKHTLSNGRIEDILVNQVGDNAIFVAHDSDNLVFSVSFRLIGGGMELSRMVIASEYRDNRIGTFLLEASRNIAKYVNTRLLLFPYPPLAEVRNQNMNAVQEELAVERLVHFYSKRGFVKCLPEYVQAIRISGMKSTHIGLNGFMSSV